MGGGVARSCSVSPAALQMQPLFSSFSMLQSKLSGVNLLPLKLLIGFFLNWTCNIKIINVLWNGMCEHQQILFV